MTRKLDKEHLEEIQSIREQFAQNANVDKMRARYGEGQINIADGTFTESEGLTQ